MDALNLSVGERVAIEFGLRLYIKERNDLLNLELSGSHRLMLKDQIYDAENALKKIQEAQWTQ